MRSPSFHLRRKSHRGFSLLEVMIALLVLSIGLLGIAGLQIFSLRYNHQSYERTQATILVNEIMEKIRANRVAVDAGNFNSVSLGSAYGDYASFGTCPTTCTPTELFNHDVYLWKKRLQDPGMLTQGQGGIAYNQANQVVTITVSWQEENTPQRQMAQARIF